RPGRWAAAVTLLVVFLALAFALRPRNSSTTAARFPLPAPKSAPHTDTADVAPTTGVAVPESIADFNSSETSGKEISAWSSYQPNPRASCSTTIDSTSGEGG